MSSTLGFLPVFLFAAQGALVRSELGFDEAQLGIAVSTFFATGAMLSAPAGRLSERLGPRTGMLAAAAAIAGVLIAIATMARSFGHLVVLLGIAGAVNALAQTSGDLSVARGVPQRLQGLAFGIKTSCVPLATLFAGVAIPVVGVRYGWRSSFLAAAIAAALVAALVPRGGSFRQALPTRSVGKPDAGARALLMLAIAGALSIGAVNTMGAFYAESAMRHGLSPSAAGWWLAAGSLAAVATRVGLGARGDRMAGGHLAMVAWLWVAGGVGLVLLAPARSMVLLAAGTAVAFTAGSGWTGLFLTAVVRSSPRAPAAATGIVMTGQLGGSVIGPLVFGAVAARGSYTGAWIFMALALLVAAALMHPAERMLANPAPTPTGGNPT